LAAAVRPLIAAHSGQSGLYPLAKGRDAFAARLALTETAQRSLDLAVTAREQIIVGRSLIAHDPHSCKPGKQGEGC
jgi:putative cardiolipin synthase